jgi:hypothetical protein
MLKLSESVSHVDNGGFEPEVDEVDEENERSDRIEFALDLGVVSLSQFVEASGCKCASIGASRHVLHNRRCRSCNHALFGGLITQLRQVTVPHLRHGATRSRAQGPILLDIPSDEDRCRNWFRPGR